MVNSLDEIDTIVKLLELKKIEEEQLLKKQLEITVENLAPINLLKNTLYDLQNSNEIKITIAQIAVAYSSKILSKKIIEVTANEPLRMFGYLNILNKCTQHANENSHWIVAIYNTFTKNLFQSPKDNQ